MRPLEERSMKSATFGLFVFLTLGTAAAFTTTTVFAQTTEIKKAGSKTKKVVKKAGHETKEGAEAVGEKTKDGLSKTGEVITDGWITTHVKAKFVGEDLLKNSDIDVDTKDHVVTLKGTVTSAAARARAAHEAKEVEGVHSVVNHLTIGPKK
jgi:osmotically-inducible protein OsmY